MIPGYLSLIGWISFKALIRPVKDQVKYVSYYSPSSIRNVDSKDEIKNLHWLHDSTQVETLSFHQLRLAGATPQYSCHTYQNHATQDGPEQVESIRI